MQAMVQKMEATQASVASKSPPSNTSCHPSSQDRRSAPRPAPAARPAPEAKKDPPLAVTEIVKKKYSMDYSRFDQLEVSDDEDGPDPRGITDTSAPGPPRDLHKRMPAKFLEAMRFNEEVQKRGSKPQELAKAERLFQEAFDEASPDVRDEIWEMLRAGGADLPGELKQNFIDGNTDSLKSALSMSQGTLPADKPVEPRGGVCMARTRTHSHRHTHQIKQTPQHLHD